MHLPWVWDYDIDAAEFRALLAGKVQRGRLGRDWAAVRLIEYAPYEDIIQYLSFAELAEGWPRWRPQVRSQSRRRGVDFLVAWLENRRPELIA